MELTLRSQMIAGATAVVGAGAIALTPVAPAVSIPSISAAKAEVALAAFDNPLGALLDTAGLVGNYLLNGAFTTPSVDFPFSNIPDGPLGAAIEAGLRLQGFAAPGILPNIVLNPLPVASQLVNNWLGYAWIGGQAAFQVGTDITNIIWTIPATAVQVGLDLLTLNFNQALLDIQSAVQNVIGYTIDGIQTVINAASAIIGSVVAKASAVINFLVSDAGQIVNVISGQLAVVTGAVVNAFQTIVDGISAPNPIEGVWNAAVEQLLSPAGLPGVVVNLTEGAGILTGPNPLTDFVPSVRTVATGALTGVADALATVPASAASVRSAAAVKAAPAAEAVAGDNQAADAPAASAASVADDTSAAADAPAPAKGKAAAGKAGRR